HRRQTDPALGPRGPEPRRAADQHSSEPGRDRGGAGDRDGGEPEQDPPRPRAEGPHPLTAQPSGLTQTRSRQLAYPHPPAPAYSYTPSTRHPSRSPTSSNAPSAPAACTPVTCRYWRTGTPSHHLSCTGHGPAQPVTVTGLPAVRGVIRCGRPLSIPRAST